MGLLDGFWAGSGLVFGIAFGLWVLRELFDIDLIAKLRGKN